MLFFRPGGVLLALLLLVAAVATESATPASAQAQALELPDFTGLNLDGKRLAMSSFAGKRRVVLLFNPGIPQARVFARAVANLASERSRHNFELIGVAMGLDPAPARELAKELALDFPIFDDSKGEISGRLRLQAPLVLLGVDAQGHVTLTMGSFEGEDLRPVASVENQLRRHLRLPEAGTAPDGELALRPVAPPFDAKRLGGGERFRLGDLAGKPVVLVFFLHNCPHCHEALRFFKKALAEIPEQRRPVLIGVSSEDRAYTVETALKEEKLDFFPVLVDPDRKIRDAYGVFAAIPDTVMIDADGRIVNRLGGWSDGRHPKIARMVLAQMAGVDVPMLLDADGFSGNQVCAVCHPSEAATWQFTSHAVAFDTLVAHGVDHDEKCVSCHVVGFDRPGGYSLELRQKHLEDVGCEACHGAGGGHVTGKPPPTDIQGMCKQCHNPTHSMGFEYASFVGKVSHRAIAGLSDAERESMLLGRGKPRDLLPTTSDIVGSKACKSCHEREYRIWSVSRHARAIQTLRKKGKDDDVACLRCHVTGFERPGGFQETVSIERQPDLARVGCEDCHGPGEEHIKKNADRIGTIVKLGDKCDSCVIMQICGSCHDEANDPGFRFHIGERIDDQRHGPE